MKLQLYYPVKPFEVTQPFGVNGNYYRSHGINILGHDGLDLEANHGQPVYASHDGLAYYEVDNSQGHGVVIRTTDLFDYNGGQSYFKTIYWHLANSDKEPALRSPVEPWIDLTKPGMPVKAGDLIGYADNTGFSTGDHLHWALKPCMPGEPLGTFYNSLQTNGYFGCIDQTPYLNGLYAEDISQPKHTFYFPMKYGDIGPEIVYLQKLLTRLGYFQSDCTGYYGQITRAAVFQFQKEKVIKDVGSFIAVWSSFGRSVGSYTLPVLNQFS